MKDRSKKNDDGFHPTHFQSDQKDSDIKIWIPLLAGVEIVRNAFRQYLLEQIKWSFGLLPLIQSFDSKLFTIYCRIFTFLGSEDAYWFLLPSLYWIAPVFGRSLILLWGMCVYFADYLKNFLCLPRPERKFIFSGNTKSLDCAGYGWPSLHSMNAIALPFFIIRSCFGSVWTWPATNEILQSIQSSEGFLDDSRVHFILAWVAAVVWMFSVCYSRLYLGVHSPADVQGGLILGGLIFQFWSSFSDSFDNWLLTSPNASFWIVLMGLFFFSIIPHVEPMNGTLEEVCSLVMFLTGFCFWQSMYPDILAPPVAYTFSILGSRILIGFASLFVAYMGTTIAWNKLTGDVSLSGVIVPVTPFRAGKMFVRYGLGCGAALTILAPTVFNYLNI